MKSKDPKVYQALTNLRASVDFGTVVGALKIAEQEAIEQCYSCEGTPLYRAQGAAKAYRELLELIATAPQTLEKFKR
jgi:hypothetical protein